MNFLSKQKNIKSTLNKTNLNQKLQIYIEFFISFANHNYDDIFPAQKKQTNKEPV